MKRDSNKILADNNLKQTRQRLMVLDEIIGRDWALSQPDLEKKLGNEIDRVTLYRILNVYEEKGILHKVIDSNGTTNYAICSTECTTNQHHDEHLHFNCINCKKLYCLNVEIPQINVPKNFKADSFSLISYGTCEKCNSQAKVMNMRSAL
ncbi:MAG: transcriptional repressor [Pedobacter sp.]|nr:transcriptional repressor [Pedobacter sp.]